MISGGLILPFRIVGAVSLGFIGIVIGGALAEGDGGFTEVVFWAAPPVGFAAFGAIATPPLLLPMLGKFQEWLSGIRPIQLILGTMGLIAGLLVSLPLSLALVTLPGVGSFIGPFAVSVLLGTLGTAAMVSREEELTRLLSRYMPGVAGIDDVAAQEIVVDTSAIIDGRIADIAESGFLQGTVVIPQFILDELRYIADSAESLRRQRGRRGLDVLSRLQKDAFLPVHVSEEDFEDARDVDAKLLRLAKARNAAILTNDFNLNRIADVKNIRVLNINNLANAVKVVVLPGEEMAVRIIQEGKEMGQGVGFLEDGTMVVVEGGLPHLNEQLDVTVNRVLQTVAGRMIFAQPKVVG